MSDNEFTGREFAAGVVTGVREFKVDKYGRLTGVTFEKVWRPGENVAACCRDEANPYGNIVLQANQGIVSLAYGQGSIWGGPYTVARTEEPKRKPKPKDDHPLDKCSCGFYAYYDGSRDYRADARISGVIEGYGETLVGTRGFRARKARIVALCIPTAQHRVDAIGERTLSRIQRNYPDVPTFDTFKRMIAEYPPDYGLELSPETDDQFWERSA